MLSSKNFYTRLPLSHLTLNELLEKKSSFESVPEDWCIILTDIVKSTEHFKAEHYQEINLVAVSSVGVVLNIAKHHNISIPFVYGGDGATLLVPPALVAECKARLATLRSNTLSRFAMDLRVSFVPISAVFEAGFSVRVAKLFISTNYHQAIFLGDGIRYAEAIMKNTTDYLLPLHTKHRPIDLSGLECKWDALFPPRKGDEVISLIVHPLAKHKPEEVFYKVLEELDKTYGSFEKRHPIHPKVFSPTTHWRTIVHASHLRYGRVKISYIFMSLFYGIFKALHLFFKIIAYKFSKNEIPDMSTSSDTLKVDNTLKTIFAGTPANRILLTKWLREEEKKGELLYGMNVSEASAMTCYIKESEHLHIRFIDGFGGGYTLAAIDLKKKISKHLHKE